MTNEKKIHWHKVFLSEYLGSADLDEGQDLKTIIREVTVKAVKGQDGKNQDRNVATFMDPKIKPMILNATNCRTIKRFTGTPYINLWKNVAVQIYIDPAVRAFGDTVEGLRIRPTQPTFEKPKLTQKSPNWAKAVEFISKDGTIDQIKEKYDISTADEKVLIKSKV
jgi:hypothetical protein